MFEKRILEFTVVYLWAKAYHSHHVTQETKDYVS